MLQTRAAYRIMSPMRRKPVWVSVCPGVKERNMFHYVKGRYSGQGKFLCLIISLLKNGYIKVQSEEWWRQNWFVLQINNMPDYAWQIPCINLPRSQPITLVYFPIITSSAMAKIKKMRSNLYESTYYISKEIIHECRSSSTFSKTTQMCICLHNHRWWNCHPGTKYTTGF